MAQTTFSSLHTANADIRGATAAAATTANATSSSSEGEVRYTILDNKITASWMEPAMEWNTSRKERRVRSVVACRTMPVSPPMQHLWEHQGLLAKSYSPAHLNAPRPVISGRLLNQFVRVYNCVRLSIFTRVYVCLNERLIFRFHWLFIYFGKLAYWVAVSCRITICRPSMRLIQATQ